MKTKFDWLNILLAYIFLPFLLLYWLSLIIWIIQGYANEWRERIDKAYEDEYNKCKENKV